MPLDALCLTAVAAELRAAVAGGKIDKLYQPTRDEAVLYVRGQGENVRLLLSANPGHPRANLTTLNRENPEQPPMFCMLLRKHLQGARILELNQPPLERILEFRLETLDELGDRVERRLVLEAMGRSANLLLLDGEGRIIDCIRRVDGDLGRGQRQLLPGLFYRQPPAPDKLNPFTIEPEELRLVLENPLGKEWDKLLLDSFTGLSPLVARELAFRAGGDRALHLTCWCGGASRWISPFCPSSSMARRRKAGPRLPSPKCWTSFTSAGRRPTGCASGGRTWSRR